MAQWTRVYRSWGSVGSFSGGQYSALLPASYAADALGRLSWDVQIGEGKVGFSHIYDDDGEPTPVLERSLDEGIELIVVHRTFHGIRPDELELVEEFRLLFDLWEDRPTRTYYHFDDAGNAEKAAIIEPNEVRILSSLLRRYQAAKQLHLALYFDSVHFFTDLPDDRQSWKHKDSESHFEYLRDHPDLGSKKFSRLLGKRILPPPPREQCGLWPFEREEQFEIFVIGVTAEGEDIVHTADPDKLANYFGANPESPHYLTPVYFRREVLNKYYAEPDRFLVRDGMLHCAGLWGVQLDNDHADYVMVFLGDLGRDLPFSEAQYWKSFNITPPDEGPSETVIRRSFRAEFAGPKSADLRFAHSYKAANDAWHERTGEPLFLPLHEDDRHIINKLHIPVGDSQAEFDEQVLYLAKLLVDYLNESAIAAAVGKKPKDEKGLAKLQRLLESQGVADARTLLRPFANIQGLRSRGAAHRKGSGFDITTAIGDVGRREGFKQLLEASITTLDELKKIAETSPSDDTNPEPNHARV